MKLLFQLFLTFIVGPAVAIAMFYAACAFIAWDWWWAWTADPMARFFFVAVSTIPAIFGCFGGGIVASELD